MELKTKDAIVDWLEYECVRDYEILDDLSVNVNCSVDFYQRNLKCIPVKFNKIKGRFTITHNKLITLHNCPVEVDEAFDCSNNKLISLEGSPLIINNEQEFYCNHNKLISLKGITPNLKMLDCRNNKLKSLEYLPKVKDLYIDKYLENDSEYKKYIIYQKLTGGKGENH